MLITRRRESEVSWSQPVAVSHIVEQCGHQLIVENIFVQVAATRSCEEVNNVVAFSSKLAERNWRHRYQYHMSVICKAQIKQ